MSEITICYNSKKKLYYAYYRGEILFYSKKVSILKKKIKKWYEDFKKWYHEGEIY